MNEQADPNVPLVSVPPAIYPACSIGGGYLLQRLIPLPQPTAGTFEIPGGVLLVIATLLIIWSIITLRKASTTILPHQSARCLVTAGPFRFSRNPIYLAFMLLVLSSALAMANLWMLMSLPVVMWLLSSYAIRPEEEHLQHQFGDNYTAYSGQVRRWW